MLKRNTREYKNLHARIKYYKGYARDLDCVDCGNQALEWSWVHGTDQLDITNYVPRCRSCHIKYDGPVIQNRNQFGENNGNCRFTEQIILEMRQKYSSGQYTHRRLAEEYSTSRGHVARILNGTAWQNSKEL